jgi:hypothetical protein
MTLRALLTAGGLATATLLACARAQDALPPAEEVLLVVDSTAVALDVIPVDAPGAAMRIPLGSASSTPSGVSARNGWAIIPMGASDTVAVVDLAGRTVARSVALAPGSGATGSAIVDDSIAYVANPGLNTVTRINYLTGDTASVAVGRFPQGIAFTRGRIFVLNGNLPASQPPGPSWVSIIDPATNRPVTGVDSIAMPGPGNAAFADVAQDGVLYVMNSGPADGLTEGRLTLIDPVGRRELGNFVGFGNAPGRLATNGTDRLYVASPSEGLLVFDLVNRRLLRGEGNGVSIPGNSGVAVDSHDRVYALEAGACTGTPGKVHVLRTNLTEARTIDTGSCPVAAVVTEVPPP